MSYLKCLAFINTSFSIFMMLSDYVTLVFLFLFHIIVSVLEKLNQSSTSCTLGREFQYPSITDRYVTNILFDIIFPLNLKPELILGGGHSLRQPILIFFFCCCVRFCGLLQCFYFFIRFFFFVCSFAILFFVLFYIWYLILICPLYLLHLSVLFFKDAFR